MWTDISWTDFLIGIPLGCIMGITTIWWCDHLADKDNDHDY